MTDIADLLNEAADVLGIAKEVGIDEGILDEEDFEGDDLPERCRAAATAISTWAGGDLPEEGMVLVDAQTLRKAITRVQAKDVLHPAGECLCGYQGECAWCQMDEWRNRATIAEASEASTRKRWAELGDLYNEERARRQATEQALRGWKQEAMERRKATLREAQLEVPEQLPPMGQGRLDQAIDALVEKLPPDIMDTKFNERCYRGDPCTVCQAEPTVRDIISNTPAWGRCEGCCEEVCPKHQHTADGATWCSYCAEATTDDASPHAEAP